MGGAEPLSGASCGREQQDVVGGLRGAVEALEEEEIVGGMFGLAYTGGDSTPSTLRGAEAACGDLATNAIPGIDGPASGARRSAGTPEGDRAASPTSGGVSVKQANDLKVQIRILRESLSTAKRYTRMLENTVHMLTKDNSRLTLEVAETRDAEAGAESVAPLGGAARTRRKKRRLSAKGTKAVFLVTVSPLQCDMFGILEVNLPVLVRLHACGLRLSITGSASSVSGAKYVNFEHAWFPAPRRTSSAAGGRAPLPLEAAVPGGASDAGRSELRCRPWECPSSHY
jgi:hypothetical protein